MLTERQIPFLGVALAILITTALDANDLSVFSALPLAPLFGIFWFWQNLSRADIGLSLGRLRHYVLALLHPALVLGLATVLAFVTGAIDTSKTDWNKAILNLTLMSVSTVLVVTLTEEGFFRGWLWASARKIRLTDMQCLIATSIAFTLWHLSAVLLPTGFNPPIEQVPVFLMNATLIGLIWGMLRWISDSIIVTSVAHGVWNGFAYIFFGFGERSGALGIIQTDIYGPEVGYVGVILNLSFALALWFLVLKPKVFASKPA